MAQKKENSASQANNWWTHTLVMDLELQTRQTVLKEEKDKSVKLSTSVMSFYTNRIENSSQVLLNLRDASFWTPALQRDLN